MNDAFTEAYPLYWPEGRPRTRDYGRVHSKFRTTFAVARDEVVREVTRLLGGRYYFDKSGFVMSTNVALRRDGLPLAGQSQPKDPGAAVYFERNKKRVCFACDKWLKVEDNLYAIAKTIEALRGIDRWGTGDMLNAAFMGFESLPAPAHWSQVLGVSPRASSEEIRNAYRTLAFNHHPDRGGSTAKMAELTAARDAALAARERAA